mmetsp:Transcript_14749/g.31778  ORF Transcript_14749/g.31778 Transcript_14749/m.31778 type:complete len:478 (+) Transcript_14749:204-1637(+)
MRANFDTLVLLVGFLPSTNSFGTSSVCEEYTDEISHHIRNGQLSLARATAVPAVSAHPECERSIAKSYVEVSDALLNKGNCYLSLVDSVARNNSSADMNSASRSRPRDSMPCWDGSDSTEDAANRWDTCCSALSRRDTASSLSANIFMESTSKHASVGEIDSLTESECKSASGLPLCCDLFVSSPSHLRLPALREVGLTVRVSMATGTDAASAAVAEKNVTLSLEQDGFLRPFDISSILWPAGYLLTLCVASPRLCGAIELGRAIDAAIESGRHNSFAIELGAGVGGPSIAMSLNIQRVLLQATNHRKEGIGSSQHSLVLATDRALHSLALVIANARTNHASVDAVLSDYSNLTALSELRRERAGFAVVLGSSLQTFFGNTEDPESPLWSALDILLDPNNPQAVAALSHTRTEPVNPPNDGRYKLCRRISGDVFGMQTRSGDTSDFHVSLFQVDVEANVKATSKQNMSREARDEAEL